MSKLEVVTPLPEDIDIKAVLFDFDGTISTLRQGWEEIMEPLMVEMICGGQDKKQQIIEEVKQYIDKSTGIQTIYQMIWLKDKVEEYGINPEIKDPWEYKAEYNRRLLKMVNSRLEKLERGELNQNDFIIKGSIDFLNKLKERGLELFLASGTDHPDVVHEAKVLGVKKYFTRIAGAPIDRVDSSKEAVIFHLLQERGLDGKELMVIGDGKVEISLGVEKGAIALGMATDEVKREGINPWKRKRLIKAGAHLIAGDFFNYKKIPGICFS